MLPANGEPLAPQFSLHMGRKALAIGAEMARRPLVRMCTSSMVAPPWLRTPIARHLHYATRGWGSATMEATVTVAATYPVPGASVQSRVEASFFCERAARVVGDGTLSLPRALALARSLRAEAVAVALQGTKCLDHFM